MNIIKSNFTLKRQFSNETVDKAYDAYDISRDYKTPVHMQMLHTVTFKATRCCSMAMSSNKPWILWCLSSVFSYSALLGSQQGPEGWSRILRCTFLGTQMKAQGSTKANLSSFAFHSTLFQRFFDSLVLAGLLWLTTDSWFNCAEARLVGTAARLQIILDPAEWPSQASW